MVVHNTGMGIFPHLCSAFFIEPSSLPALHEGYYVKIIKKYFVGVIPEFLLQAVNMALKNIIGQDKTVNIILKTLSRGRVPSAYLFAGESGIGKRFTALNLAKAVNCLKGRDALSVLRDELNRDTHYSLPITGYDLDACDECISCRKIDSNNHPDFLLVSPEKGEIRIDEIRAVEEALLFKPYEGRKKVVIIDDADMMNQSAANAFLKTLEEPPDESLLILVAANPDRLPETIRSRCSRLNFKPLSYEACEKVIKAVNSQSTTHGQSAVKTKNQWSGVRGQDDDQRLPTVVRLSMGRPGLAISSDILNERERFLSLLKNMLNGNNEVWADRDEIEQWFDASLIFMRDIITVKIASDGNAACEDILINADISNFISEIAGKTTIKDIIRAYYKVLSLKAKLGFNLNKNITWNYTASVFKEVMGHV